MSARTFTLRRDLLRELVVRDVRLRYRGRVLGLLWSQLGPIASVVVFTIVFSRVIPLEIDDYPVFSLIGIEAWQWFHGGLSAGAVSIGDNRDLVRHAGFPLRIIPVFTVASQLASFVLALPVILGTVVLWTGRIPATAVWLPALVAVQFVVTLSAAYVLAAAHVFLRDTADVLGVALRLMFFITPVIYDSQRLLSSRFKIFFNLNPMAHLIRAQRDALLRGRTPELVAIGVFAAIACVVLVVAVQIFGSGQHRFVDEV